VAVPQRLGRSIVDDGSAVASGSTDFAARHAAAATGLNNYVYIAKDRQSMPPMCIHIGNMAKHCADRERSGAVWANDAAS
jgi:hypothetical protein